MISETGFFSSLSTDHLQRYSRIIQEGISVRRHFDLLKWLQGEMQYYLPHEIMLATWGNFSSNFIRYDVVSSLPGVQTAHLAPEKFLPELRGLYKLWVDSGKLPCASGGGLNRPLFGFLQGMRSSTLHGISDKRGHHDCLYVFYSSKAELSSSTLSAMEILLPYLDNALRRVEPVSHHSAESEDDRLSERENEIMDWVKIGKSNDEIASILSISCYTVKNHIQHIFKKLNVYNRLQAVSKIGRIPSFS